MTSTLRVDAAPVAVAVVQGAAVRLTDVQGTRTVVLAPETLAVADRPPEVIGVGFEGPPGAPGAGLQISGAVATASALPDDLTAEDAGVGYIATDTGSLWIYDGTQWIDAGPIRGPQGLPGVDGQDGAVGQDGAAATITVGSTTTGAPGTDASVTNSGTPNAAVLVFTIPRGSDGADSTVPGPPGNDGLPGSDGEAATIAVGTVTTGAPGTDAEVVNSGTATDAVFDMTIPRGDTGDPGADGADSTVPGPPGDPGTAATIEIGTVTTLDPGADATAENVGTDTAAIINLGLPRGSDGSDGSDGTDGAAATIAVGTVTTVDSGDPATVTNSGTANAAVLDFELPQGATGATGPSGVVAATPPLTYNSGTQTVGIGAANAGGEGSMSAAHYNLVNNATAAATAATLALRDASGGAAFADLAATSVAVAYPGDGAVALTITGTAQPATSGATGANAAKYVDATGAPGQATSNTSGTGGSGGANTMVGGAGGAATSGTGSNSGGSGGTWVIQGGNGGASASSAGIGGVGGPVSYIGGAGGNNTALTGTTIGGTGGAVILTGGGGGTVASADGVRGSGGPVRIYGGAAAVGTGSGGTTAPVTLDWDGAAKRGGVAVGKGSVGSGLAMDVAGRVSADSGYAGILGADLPATPVCSLTLSGNQAITDAATNTAMVSWTAEETDDFGMHTANDTRITIPSGWDGKWEIATSLQYSGNAGGTLRGAIIYKNGSFYKAIFTNEKFTGAGNDVPPKILKVAVVAGDYFEVQGYQDTGGNLNATNNSTFTAVFLSK